MNSTMLKAAILQILKDRDEEPANEKFIMLALTVEYRTKVTYSELRSTMKSMDEKRLLVGIHDDEVLFWGLSTKGELKAIAIWNATCAAGFEV